MKFNKLLLCCIVCGASLAYADNAKYQSFENEYNLGYGFEQGTLINGDLQTANTSAQDLNFEVEHLFDNGIWFDANFNMVTQYNQPDLGPLNGGSGGGDGPQYRSYAFGQNQAFYSLTGKVGYGFDMITNHLQLIPYGMFGRTTNWATSTVVANGYEPITQDYFFTGGLGGRMVYRINDYALVYLDQIYSYNWDNSGAVKSIQTATYGKSYAATNYQFTTTIGAKFNVYKSLQLGVSGFWNNFQPQSNISGIVYTPTNTFGEMVTVGLTY